MTITRQIRTPIMHRAVEVTLRVAPQLVRYAGCLRGGIKSRSWGNSHDGVSLVVETVKALEVRAPTAR